MLRLPKDVPKTLFPCGSRENKRQGTRRKLLSLARGHIAVHGEPGVGFPVGDIDELVHSGGAKETRCFSSEIVGEVILLQWRKAEMEVDVHQKTGHDHGQEEGTIAVIKTSWRP